MELCKILRDAGIVGAGGAGFPSYAKLAEGANTLLINGAECEPLLYTDYSILKYEMERVIAGATGILEKGGIARAVLAIKEHTAKRLGYFFIKFKSVFNIFRHRTGKPRVQIQLRRYP